MFDKVSNNLKILEKSLKASWLRNEVISQNLANIDTPGYKKKTVNFEQYLNDAMDGSSFSGFRTNSRHIQIGGDNVDSVGIKVVTDNKELSTRIDGNNVDIEAETAEQAKNTLKYYTLVQSLSSGYKRILNAINEGKK